MPPHPVGDPAESAARITHDNIQLSLPIPMQYAAGMLWFPDVDGGEPMIF